MTLQAPTEVNTQILINKHKESSFLVEDILKTQSNYDLSKIGSYTSDGVIKIREFGENPERTTPSRAWKQEGVTTMYGSLLEKRRRDSLN